MDDDVTITRRHIACIELLLGITQLGHIHVGVITTNVIADRKRGAGSVECVKNDLILAATNCLGNHLNKLTPLIKVNLLLHENVAVFSRNEVTQSHSDLTVGNIEWGYIGLGNTNLCDTLANFGELISRTFNA